MHRGQRRARAPAGHRVYPAGGRHRAVLLGHIHAGMHRRFSGTPYGSPPVPRWVWRIAVWENNSRHPKVCPKPVLPPVVPLENQRDASQPRHPIEVAGYGGSPCPTVTSTHRATINSVERRGTCFSQTSHGTKQRGCGNAGKSDSPACRYLRTFAENGSIPHGMHSFPR